MSMMSGTVEAVSTKYGFAIKLDGDPNWYSTKPEWIDPKPQKGDSVEFDSGPDGKKYLQKCKITGSSNQTSSSGQDQTAVVGKMMPKNQGCFPVDPFHPDRSIIRQNAVTNARELLQQFAEQPLTVEEVLDVARQIEAYTSGDRDAEEAKAALEAMGLKGE